MYKKLRTEKPGIVLPGMPRKNKQNSMATNLMSGIRGRDDDASSISSVSTVGTTQTDTVSSLKALGHGRSSSRNSKDMTRSSVDGRGEPVSLFREAQRISLRAFLRTLLKNQLLASSAAMKEFLSLSPTKLTNTDIIDIERRKAMDEKRLEEQKKFYEIARKRAADLDVYMEQYVH